MKVLLLLITLILALTCATGIGHAELHATQIDCSLCPAHQLYITYDDAPYEAWQSGLGYPPSWTDYLVDYLAQFKRTDSKGVTTVGVPITWFLVDCHFSSQPPPLPPPDSVICMGARNANASTVAHIVKVGQRVANHTHSHTPIDLFPVMANGSAVVADELLTKELSTTQYFLDPYQTDGWHFYRAVGLDYPSWATGVVNHFGLLKPGSTNVSGLPLWAHRAVNSHPYLSKLVGPVGVDVGGGFTRPGLPAMGGDWDCQNQKLTAEQCGDLYLRNIHNVTQTHGAIVLLHNYVVDGFYAYLLIRHILKGLDPDIQLMDLKDHPLFAAEHNKGNTAERAPPPK